MRRMFLFAVLLLMIAPLGMIAAQDMPVPSVTVSDQVVLDGTATIDSVYSAGPGFVVLHIDNNGSPGPVAGFAPVNPGWNFNVSIPVDASVATPVLFAMLHVDDGTIGAYEFDGASGLDNPVSVDGQVVTPAFNVAILDATDQFITDGKVVIRTVVMAEGGWVVIHNNNEGAPGPVLGQTLVSAGTSTNVEVEISETMETSVWPMLHVDTGVVGEYEFGTVEGADGPVVLGGVATKQIFTVPHMRVADQIVVHGDGMTMEGMTPTLTAASVLSEGAGFLVVHIDSEGAPGPVAGYAPVSAGLNENVVVELDPSVLTPVLWPMLHVDTGEAGVYEFGTVEGADGPVRVGDSVVTFPINAAPSLTYSDQALSEEGTITIDSALIDAAGWIAIHSNNGGAPGPVLATYPLRAGNNTNIVIALDAEAAGNLVFPMLHYDTNEAGVYEFGTVEGADGPVRVGGNVVVGPLNIQ